MPISRPLLFVLLGAVLIGAAFFATRGRTAVEPASDAATPAVEPAPEPDTAAPDSAAPAKPAPSKTEAPATTDIRQALAGAATVESGTLDLSASGRSIKLTVKGNFQSRGLAKTPLFRFDVTAKGPGTTLEVGAIAVGEKAYLVRGGKAVSVAPASWNALGRGRARAAEGGANNEKYNGYSKTELDSLKFKGQEDLAGTPVLHFTGRADPKEARDGFDGIANLFGLAEFRSPLPSALARSVTGGTINVWVGAEDQIVRREKYRYTSPAGPFNWEYTRGDVNEPQEIAVPANASSKTALQAGWDRDAFGLAYSALLGGVFVIEPGDGPVKPVQRPLARISSPANVKRAVKAHKVVVLHFRQRGADDAAVASSVNAQRGKTGVAVFTIPVGKAPKYAEVGGANVVRAPSIVILDVKGRPRLFEGFIDAATLSQAVTDAR